MLFVLLCIFEFTAKGLSHHRVHRGHREFCLESSHSVFSVFSVVNFCSRLFIDLLQKVRNAVRSVRLLSVSMSQRATNRQMDRRPVCAIRPRQRSGAPVGATACRCRDVARQAQRHQKAAARARPANILPATCTQPEKEAVAATVDDLRGGAAAEAPDRAAQR